MKKFGSSLWKIFLAVGIIIGLFEIVIGLIGLGGLLCTLVAEIALGTSEYLPFEHVRDPLIAALELTTSGVGVVFIMTRLIDCSKESQAEKTTPQKQTTTISLDEVPG